MSTSLVHGVASTCPAARVPAPSEVFRKAHFTYFAHNTLQVPRVARQCMVALCEGAGALGAASSIVSYLVRPDPSEPPHPPLRELYGVEHPLHFSCYELPFLHISSNAGLIALARLAVYCRHLLRSRATLTRSALTVLSARNVSVLHVLSSLRPLFGPSTVVLADVHGLPKARFGQSAYRRVDGNVCITAHLAQALASRLRIPSERIRVAHSGVKPSRFSVQLSKADAAKRLGIDRGRPVLCYTGKVYYRYEEVSYLIDIAAQLGNEATMVIVGGRPDQIPPWREECQRRGVQNVVFTGFRPPSDIPLFLRAADLLVMYYSPSPLNEFRSPGKLFEYLASGTPLVAARFPGVEEVVTEGVNGFMVEPYQPAAAASRIRALLSTREGWQAIGARAAQTAANYTWAHRAERFLSFAAEIAARRLEGFR